MIDRFAELLLQLSAELNIDLYADKHNACKIVFENGLHAQMEIDTRQESLLLATFLCEIPPGKFRENTLKDALKSNHPFPENGTLAYSQRNNQLALFAYLHLHALTGRTLAEFLKAFLDKADAWRKGVSSGNTSHLVHSAPKPSTNLFDLKP
jgi:Tir chaperone protein (CesT) family